MRVLQDGTAETPEPPLTWQRWCRLCAKDDCGTADEFVSVFSKLEDDQIDSPTLSSAIGKYFWVNICLKDTSPKVVCAQCHTLVTSLVAFTERVNKVQTMFFMLQNAKAADAEEAVTIRNENGLLPGDWLHIIAEKKPAEPKMDEEEEDAETDPEEEEEQSGVTEFQINMTQKFKSFHVDKEAQDEFEDLTEGGPTMDDVLSEAAEEEEVEEEDVTETTLEEYVFADEEATQITRVKNEKNYESDGDEEQNENDEEEETEGGILRHLDDLDGLEEDARSVDEADERDDSDLFRELQIKVEAADKDEEEQKPSSSTSASSAQAADSTCALLQPRKRGRPAKQPGETPSKYTPKKPRSSDEGGEPHADTFKYACSVCPKRYKNATSYRKHMSEAHAITCALPNFECAECSRQFATERLLGLHERSHLPLAVKCDVPCPFCEKKFTKAAVMRQHVSGTHHGQKPFICDECGKGLKTNAALNEHKLVHTDECPFECTVCQARFKNLPRLKIHLDTHSENPYVCSECGMKLNTRRTLKMHQLVHVEEKTLQCDFCSASFKRAKALKNHLILHTGLRPYKCNFCDKTFSNGSNCRSHKKKLHPEMLAAEEALGIKNEPIITPKLDELRASTIAIETPRQVKRNSGGLPPRMRALLLAAENREKRAEATAAANPDRAVYTIGDDIDEDEEEEDEEFVYEIIDQI